MIYQKVNLVLSIRRARSLVEIKPLRRLKPAVGCSININGIAKTFFQTFADEEGGVNPNWNSATEFEFPAAPMMVGELVLDIKHLGKVLGERFLGKTKIPLTDLFAEEGIGNEKSYPVLRLGVNVGEIIISYQIKLVETEMLSDLKPAAGVVEEGNNRPTGLGFSPIFKLAACMGLADQTAGFAEDFGDD